MERKVTYQSRIEKVVADAEQRKIALSPYLKKVIKKNKNIRDSRAKDNFERQPQEAFLIENQEGKDENMNKRISSLGMNKKKENSMHMR